MKIYLIKKKIYAKKKKKRCDVAKIVKRKKVNFCNCSKLQIEEKKQKHLPSNNRVIKLSTFKS